MIKVTYIVTDIKGIKHTWTDSFRKFLEEQEVTRQQEPERFQPTNDTVIEPTTLKEVKQEVKAQKYNMTPGFDD